MGSGSYLEHLPFEYEALLCWRDASLLLDLREALGVHQQGRVREVESRVEPNTEVQGNIQACVPPSISKVRSQAEVALVGRAMRTFCFSSAMVMLLVTSAMLNFAPPAVGFTTMFSMVLASPIAMIRTTSTRQITPIPV